MISTTTSGTGVFFDGRTSRRQDVHVDLETALVLRRPDGVTIARWPLDDLREVSGSTAGLRLTLAGGEPLARLQISSEGLASAIRQVAPRLGDANAAERGTMRKVVVLSLAAVVSLTVFALYGVPAIATAATPLLPWSVDRNLGETADAQLRLLIPTEPGGFECGSGSEEQPGREALDRMARTLSDAAGLEIPVRILAVRSDFVNALALPGSPIYLFDGLIKAAKSPDEIAGVLAHEIGHVAHRDGTRHMLQAGGASLLFSFILGDFIGGTAAILVVRTLAEASYSREAERDADLYAVKMLRRIGADPRALGQFLTRMMDEDASEPGAAGADQPPGRPQKRSLSDWLSSHPASAERKAAIDAAAGPAPARPVWDRSDFLAIQRVCGKPS